MTNPFIFAIEQAQNLGTSTEQAIGFLREAADKFLPAREPAEYKIDLYSNYGSLEQDRTVSTRDEIAGAIEELLDGTDDGSYVEVWASVPVDVERTVKVRFL